MKKSRKKIIVAILLVTMLSQTLYSAAAGVFGLRAQSYAYADDEFAEEVKPGEYVDESTQDDTEVIQLAPEETDEEGIPSEEDRYAETSDEEEAIVSNVASVDEEEIFVEDAENEVETEEERMEREAREEADEYYRLRLAEKRQIATEGSTPAGTGPSSSNSDANTA